MASAPTGACAGSLTATLRQAPARLAAMGASRRHRAGSRGDGAPRWSPRAGGRAVAVTIDFQAGQTTLGPVAARPGAKDLLSSPITARRA